MHKTQLRILTLVGTMLLIFSSSSPVMGVMENHRNQAGFSGATYSYHGDKQMGTRLPVGSCIHCHPSPQSSGFSRMMESMAIDCTRCHGQMTEFGNINSLTWTSLPSCSGCHELLSTTSVKIIQNDQELFAVADANGQTGALHDQHQSLSQQGRSDLEMECTACHTKNYEAAFWHFRMKG